jgi:hypothetical protein
MILRLLVCVALWVAAGSSTAFAAATDANCPRVATEKPMSEADFWAIVDGTRAASSSQQLVLLNNELRKLSADDILAFRRTFDIVYARARTWDLWGAAYVINGGASDDGFDYFRSWLVSRGQKTFDLALRHADDLADVIPAGDGEPLEFEEFMYQAGNAWQGKTGRDSSAFHTALDQISKCDPRTSEPAGTPFDEDEAHLAARYPKLWAQFGKNPRG